MARTIQEIKNEMTQRFLAEPLVREKYRLPENVSFDQAFSRVSLESIIFYVVASAMYVLEVFFDAFKEDVEKRISTSVFASIAWYHKICLEFQYGDELILNEKTLQFEYNKIDIKRRVVAFASCRETNNGIRILVAGSDDKGIPTVLSKDVLTAFNKYLNSRKPAGVVLEIYSFPPDRITSSITIQYNPQVLRQDGALISNPEEFPVEQAIKNYLKKIVYGGTFNKTKLVDAIQKAEGVEDVVLGKIEVRTASERMNIVEGNNYVAKGGSFVAEKLKENINYVLSV